MSAAASAAMMALPREPSPSPTPSARRDVTVEYRDAALRQLRARAASGGADEARCAALEKAAEQSGALDLFAVLCAAGFELRPMATTSEVAIVSDHFLTGPLGMRRNNNKNSQRLIRGDDQAEVSSAVRALVVDVLGLEEEVVKGYERVVDGRDPDAPKGVVEAATLCEAARRGASPDLPYFSTTRALISQALGNVHLLERVLARGADVNAADYDGRTALHVASAEGYLPCAQILLDRAADVGAVDRFGNTPLKDAIRENRDDVAHLLSAHGGCVFFDPATTAHELCAAASRGDYEAIRKLVVGRVDVNAANFDRRTALHLAASEGHVNIARFLLLHGARVNVLDRWGVSPLDEAETAKHMDVADVLRTHWDEQRSLGRLRATRRGRTNRASSRHQTRVSSMPSIFSAFIMNATGNSPNSARGTTPVFPQPRGATLTD